MAVIFSKDFENNSLADVTVVGGGDVTITAAAAMAGTNLGLSCLADDANPDYIEKENLNNNSGKVRARFYFDRNGATNNAGLSSNICCCINGSAQLIFVIKIEEGSGVWYLATRIYDDAGNPSTTRYCTLTTGPHWIEFNAWKSSGSNDGGYSWTVDGKTYTGETAIDNDTRWDKVDIFEIGFGVGGSLGAGASGTMYFDQIVVNDDGGAIGAYYYTAKGKVLWGYNIPASKETCITWKTWDDGAAGAATVSGDADWGKLEVSASKEGRSNVIDFGDANPRTYTITENVYGAGSGDADLEIRGDTNPFVQDDALPAWNSYTVPTLQSWRYVQIRESRE